VTSMPQAELNHSRHQTRGLSVFRGRFGSVSSHRQRRILLRSRGGRRQSVPANARCGYSIRTSATMHAGDGRGARLGQPIRSLLSIVSNETSRGG
jgi:hypothetical protein